MPFADCSIIVEYQRGLDYLNVCVTGSAAATSWKRSWGPEIRGLWAGARDKAALTQPPWPTLKWKKSNGVPYAWFDTLVALCEPALGKRPAGTPTNSQLARQLNLTEAAIERHMTAIYKAFDIGAFAGHREVLVAIAIDQGIVTPGDIE